MVGDLRPWFRKPGWVLVLLLFVSPVGIALLWWGQHFSKNVRIGLTVASGLFFLFVLTNYEPHASKGDRHPETGKTQRAQLQPVALPPLDKGVVLTVELGFGADRKATVSGDTNLPDGTELGIDVEEPGSDAVGSQSRATVSDGRYTADGIGYDGGYPDGKYLAKVVMPIAAVQPDAVRAVIGAQGEKLTGKLVVKNDYGPTVVAQGSAVLGGAGGAARGDARRAAAQQQLLDIAQQLDPIINGGLDAEDGLRDRACVARAQRELAIVQPLRTRLEELRPDTLSAGLLRVAALSTDLCLECTAGRAGRCRQARKDLDKAVRQIRAPKASQ